MHSKMSFWQEKFAKIQKLKDDNFLKIIVIYFINFYCFIHLLNHSSFKNLQNNAHVLLLINRDYLL